MIYTLHGFLGKPADWKDFLPKDQLFPVDLYSPTFPPPSSGISAWANHFCSTLPQTSSNTLIGYSLGGRLALACLRANPSFWERVIFLSTHPGLKTEQERLNRLEHDKKWAEAFRLTPWNELLKQWNHQPLFGSVHPVRNESAYSRETLAETLVGWSLAKQDNYREFLSKVNCPITWITGENDIKFTEVAEELTFAHPKSKKLVIPGASHRLLLEGNWGQRCLRDLLKS